MANPTLQDVVTQARDILQDSVSPFRYSDPKLEQYANDYLHMMRRESPDLFFGSLTAALTNLVLANDFPLGWEYVQRAAAYVVGRADLWEAEHAESGRAAGMLGLSGRAQGAK